MPWTLAAKEGQTGPPQTGHLVLPGRFHMLAASLMRASIPPAWLEATQRSMDDPACLTHHLCLATPLAEVDRLRSQDSSAFFLPPFFLPPFFQNSQYLF